MKLFIVAALFAVAFAEPKADPLVVYNSGLVAPYTTSYVAPYTTTTYAANIYTPYAFNPYFYNYNAFPYAFPTIQLAEKEEKTKEKREAEPEPLFWGRLGWGRRGLWGRRRYWRRW